VTYTIQRIELTKKDANDLITLGREMHSESSFSKLQFNPRRVLETFNHYLDDDNKAAFIARKGETPVGFYAGYVTKYYFSDETVASDIGWFVRKPFRGTRVGLRLLDVFEEWAEKKGASETRIGFSTNINPEAFDRLMKKRGYDAIGRNYRLETKP
jgi:GNAT superfamily N-acetyltransferase